MTAAAVPRGWPLLVAKLCVALFAFAFVAAPYACAWGLPAYVAAGAVALAAASAVALARAPGGPPRRVLVSAGAGFLVLAVWTAGLLASNLRILCRLF